jgi:glycosyltransferase involved in cell wall biosynthesis
MRICRSFLAYRDKRRRYAVGYYSAKSSFTSGVYWLFLFNIFLALSRRIHMVQVNFAPTSPAELTILMPIYNKAKYLNRSLGSIRKLPLRRHRAIIFCLDDASTDDSVNTVKSLQRLDPRIVLYENAERLGTHRARLKAASLVKTEWMICLDPDDEFHGNGSVLALELAQSKQADIVQFGCICWDVPNRALSLCWREPQFITEATPSRLLDLVFNKSVDWHLHRKIFRSSVVHRGLELLPMNIRGLMLCRGEDLLQYVHIISVMTGMYYYIPNFGEVRYHGLPDNSLTEAYEDNQTRAANVAMIKRFVSEFANRSWSQSIG